MRQVELVTGVTVVSDENHLSPQRMVSVRRLGSMKSMVVSTGWPYTPKSLYGAELPLGAWALMRKPSGMGSKRLVFSRMLERERHHHAWCTKGPCAGSIRPMMPWSTLQGRSAVRKAVR